MRLLSLTLFILFNIYLIESAVERTESEARIGFESEKSEQTPDGGDSPVASEKSDEVTYEEYEYVDDGPQENSISGKSENSTESSEESFPNEVFLSLRNITADAATAFRSFTNRNDVVDLQASASDNLNVTETNATLGDTLEAAGINLRALRDAGHPPEIIETAQPGIYLPYKHAKIDTADLSDCALQGEWKPMGVAHGHLHQQITVGGDNSHQAEILQSVGSYAVPNKIIPHWQQNSFSGSDQEIHGAHNHKPSAAYTAGGGHSGGGAVGGFGGHSGGGALGGFGGHSSGGAVGGYGGHSGGGAVAGYAGHSSFGGGSGGHFGGFGGGGSLGQFQKVKSGSMLAPPPPVPGIIFGKKPGYWKSPKSKHKYFPGKGKRPGGGSFGFTSHVNHGSGGIGGFGSGSSSYLSHGRPGFGGGHSGGSILSGYGGGAGGGSILSVHGGGHGGHSGGSILSVHGGSTSSSHGSGGGAGHSGGGILSGHGGGSALSGFGSGGGASHSGGAILSGHGAGGGASHLGGGILSGHGGGSALSGFGSGGAGGSVVSGHGGGGYGSGGASVLSIHGGGHSGGSILSAHSSGGGHSGGSILSAHSSGGGHSGGSILSGGHPGTVLSGHGGSGGGHSTLSDHLTHGYGAGGAGDEGVLSISGSTGGGAGHSAALVSDSHDGNSAEESLSSVSVIGGGSGGHSLGGYITYETGTGLSASSGGGSAGGHLISAHGGDSLIPEAAFLSSQVSHGGNPLPDSTFSSSHINQGVRGGNSLPDAAAQFLTSHLNQDFAVHGQGVSDDSSSSSTFTCGKNHDHNTNYHTATFQVADHDHPSSVDVLQYGGDAAVLIQSGNPSFHDQLLPERKLYKGDADVSSSDTRNELASQASQLTAEPEATETEQTKTEDGDEPERHSYYHEITKVTKIPATSVGSVQYTYSEYETKPQSFTQETEANHEEPEAEQPQIIRELEHLSNKFQLDLENPKKLFEDPPSQELAYHYPFQEEKVQFDPEQVKDEGVTEFPHPIPVKVPVVYHKRPPIKYIPRPGKQQYHQKVNYLQPVVRKNKPKHLIKKKQNYEVQEHGERHRPVGEIFPPQKFPKQFHNPKPNFAVDRPKNGWRPNESFQDYKYEYSSGKSVKKFKTKQKILAPVLVRRPVVQKITPVIRVVEVSG